MPRREILNRHILLPVFVSVVAVLLLSFIAPKLTLAEGQNGGGAGGTNYGTISIDSLSPNPADSSINVAGSAIGGSLSSTGQTCTGNKNPGSIQVIQSAAQLGQPTTWNIDGGTLSANYALAQTAAGNVWNSCKQNPPGPVNYQYSFNIQNINVSLLANGFHTIKVCAFDNAQNDTICASASFSIQHPTAPDPTIESSVINLSLSCSGNSCTSGSGLIRNKIVGSKGASWISSKSSFITSVSNSFSSGSNVTYDQGWLPGSLTVGPKIALIGINNGKLTLACSGCSVAKANSANQYANLLVDSANAATGQNLEIGVQLNVVGPAVTLTATLPDGSPIPANFTGGNVKLSWTSANPNTTIALTSPAGPTNFSGPTQANITNGNTTINVSATTTYALTVRGLSDIDTSAANFATASVTVTVTPTPIPTADIKANGSDGPISIPYNTSASIDWTAGGVATCSITPGNWGSGIIGSGSTGNLTESVTYNLSCSGAYGSASDSVTINIDPTPTPVPLTCSPSSQVVSVGNYAFLTASGGSTTNYSWSALGGSPNSSRSTNIGTKYSSSGTKIVTVSNAGQTASCSVDVIDNTYFVFISKNGTGTGTVASTDGQVNCGVSCSSATASYVSSGVAALNATPSSDSVFTRWLSCDSVSGASCTVNVPPSRSVSVVFDLAPTPAPPVNSPPITSNVSVSESNYCSGIGVTIGGNYSDADGDVMSAYQVQIDEAGSSFSPPYSVDSGKITLSGVSKFQFTHQGAPLQFNTTYKARARAWDSKDTPSDWTNQTICNGPGCVGSGGQWKTPKHAYPQASFSYSPSSQTTGSPVSFIDTSVYYDTGFSRKWSWLFGDSGSSKKQNPNHIYNTAGNFTVDQIVTDSDDYSCQSQQLLTVKNANTLPTWKEVSPK